MSLPDVVVSADDIGEGKPNPACYRWAMERLGCCSADAVVLEDAKAGLAAGHAAGCRTIALATTQDPSCLDEEDWLPDLSMLAVDRIDTDGRLYLRVS